jgi:hypothetical protein
MSTNDHSGDFLKNSSEDLDQILAVNENIFQNETGYMVLLGH